jgi:hypothetical protein
MWLRASGVDFAVTTDDTSDEVHKVFRNALKYEGLAPKLWEEKGTRIYGVPRRTPSLAHVVPESAIPTKAPINGIDLGQVAPYVEALGDGSLPLASFQWERADQALVEADLAAGTVLSVQMSYHPGWRAKLLNPAGDTRAIEISEDGLSQMIIRPDVTGPARIRLVFDGGLEAKICWASFWIAIALLAALLAMGLPRKLRPSPTGS